MSYVVSPIGTVIMYAGIINGKHPVPEGWLLCDGSEVSIKEYEDLYKVIEITYNKGYTSTKDGQFRLPDLRGIFPKGADATKRENKSKDTTGEAYSGGDLGTYETDKVSKSIVSKCLDSHYHQPPASGNFVVDKGTNFKGQVQEYSSGTQGYYGFKTDCSESCTTGDAVANQSSLNNNEPHTGNTTEPQSLSLHFLIKARHAIGEIANAGGDSPLNSL